MCDLSAFARAAIACSLAALGETIALAASQFVKELDLRSSLVGLSAWLCLMLASSASAQDTGFTLDRFTLAPSPEDGLGLHLPSTLGPGRPSARLVLGFQRESLVSGAPGGDEVEVIRNQLAVQVALAIGLGERFELFMLLPATLYQGGQEPRGSGLRFDEPESAGVGDLQLGGSAHLIGDRERGFQLGLHAALLTPTGSPDALASDGEVGVRGSLSAAVVLEAVTFALQAGAAYRPERVLGLISSGSEASLRLGAYVPLAQRWRLLLELDGATRLGDGQSFEKYATPLEALLGGEHITGSGLRFGLAAGPGLTLAAGTPLLRVLGTLGYAPPREPPAPPAPPDRDHDGLLDPDDECPDQPEDANGFEDGDGCPDAARDGDADEVPDASDGCPTDPEDRDGIADQDGCPEAELDGDQDGIRDLDDRCPKEPETLNGIEDQDGCPDAAPPPPPETPAAVVAPPVALPEPLLFARKSAGVRPNAQPKLKQLAETLKANPELRITLEGHSSADGSAEFNQSLSEQRADAVKAWLVKRGISADRIQTRGLGVSQPLVDGDTEAARASNRRVEIKAQ
jgi:outer membrane protein OmpA-like peptidoglycan-associated protein